MKITPADYDSVGGFCDIIGCVNILRIKDFAAIKVER